MASKELLEIVNQAQQLTPDEQLELITLLVEKARLAYGMVEASPPRRKWSEIMGIAPGLLDGEDAQAWVTRTRREADESRDRQLRGADKGSAT